ncbi:MAG: glycosyltransferase [Microcoleus sp.]
MEVLVIDDGSWDQTAEIVKSFAQKDSRVILLQQSKCRRSRRAQPSH